MRFLLALVAVVVLPAAIPLPSAAQDAEKPNPFAVFDNKIEKIEKDIAKCDKTKDEKKIEKLKGDLLKEQERKDKKLQLMLRPLEEKVDKLTELKDKALDKREPTAQFDQEIAELNKQIEEIESLSKAWRKAKEAEEKKPEDAGDAGRKALKGMM